jgi:hypothetical protein
MQTVEAITADWPKMSKSAVEEIVGKYGPPNEAMDSRLIWYNNGPWKRTICYRDEVPHLFPNPHSDTLECVIDYRVPPEMFSELAKFDGSVIVDRTKGEVAARCDMESADFLAINLMHKIVTGEMDAEEARKVYTETAAAYVLSRSAPLAEGFVFQLPQEDTNFKDTTTIAGAMARQTGGKSEGRPHIIGPTRRCSVSSTRRMEVHAPRHCLVQRSYSSTLTTAQLTVSSRDKPWRFFVSGCADLPRDQHGVSVRIRQRAVLTVGVSHQSTRLTSLEKREKRLVEKIARRLGAPIEWRTGNAHQLLQDLEELKLPLVAAALPCASPSNARRNGH